jgi:hypothetical protein
LLWNSSVTIQTKNDLRRQGYTEESLREQLAQVEPMNYATAQRGKGLLVIGAKFDEVIPREDTDKLIRAFGEPEVVWLETGHYGGALIERRLYRTCAEFYSSRFTGKQFNAPQGISGPTVRVGVHYNPEFKLTVGIGIDLWRSRSGNSYVAGLLTPDGPGLYGAAYTFKGFSGGVIVAPKRVTWGLFWSVVL